MQLEKTTNERRGETKRGYEDACGLAHALELIGERWAPLVIRELLLGPRRFSELRSALPGISANVLTQRLGELEERGLVRRRKLPPPAAVQVYEATEWALEASPILCALGRWASRSPLHDPRHPVSPVAIMLSMKTNVHLARIGDLEVVIAFRFEEATYAATVRPGFFDVSAGEPENTDVTITSSADALKPVLYGGAPVEQLEVDGDMEKARRFFTLFALPPKIG